jgi:hypothetical protein
MKTALMIGSTGLIGSHLLELLLVTTMKSNYFREKDTGIKHPKLTTTHYRFRQNGNL